MTWRIPLGIALTTFLYVAFQAMAGWLIPEPEPRAGDVPDFAVHTLASAASMFVAVTAGSWMARGRFLLVALALWAVPMGVVLWVAYKITVAAQPVSLANFIVEFSVANAWMLVATLGATLAGVLLGWVLARRSAADKDRISVTP